MGQDDMYSKTYGDPASVEALSKAVIDMLVTLHKVKTRLSKLEHIKGRQLALRRINRRFEANDRYMARLLTRISKVEMKGEDE